MAKPPTRDGRSEYSNGFLYQIIHHLGWLANVTLVGQPGSPGIDNDACLVLEPRQGGDARAEASSLFLVEQYKTRPHGTWSVGDLELVLRDLRKTVPANRPTYARYRFVTDGRPGRLDTFMAFLEDIRFANGRDGLDDVEVILAQTLRSPIASSSITLLRRHAALSRIPNQMRAASCSTSLPISRWNSGTIKLHAQSDGLA